MQYVFFEKKVYTVYNGVWLLSTISYGKKIGGAGCTSCSPNNFVEGATAPPIPTSMLIMHLKTSEKITASFHTHHLLLLHLYTNWQYIHSLLFLHNLMHALNPQYGIDAKNTSELS